MTDLMAVTVTVDGALTDRASVQVQIDGGAPLTITPPSTGLPAVVRLEDRVGQAVVTAVPPSADHWPVQATVTRAASGRLATRSLGAGWVEQLPGVRTPLGDATGVRLHASRVRHATDRALEILTSRSASERENLPAGIGRDGNFLVAPAGPVHVVLSAGQAPGGTPLGPAFTAVPMAFDDPGTGVVLELAGTAPVPALLGVSWRDDFRAVAGGLPLSFLLSLHPDVWQNPRRYLGPYPWSFDYVYHLLFKDLNYGQGDQADPLTGSPEFKGIALQARAAQAEVVSVVPLNRKGPEVGSFLRAGYVERVLADVARLIRVSSGGVPPASPDPAALIDRVALAGFSASCGRVAQFLVQNAWHPFWTDLLQEVYLFDPVGLIGPICAAALAWQAARTAGSRHIRVFAQADHPAYAAVRAAGAGGRNSVHVLPASLWYRAIGQLKGTSSAVEAARLRATYGGGSYIGGRPGSFPGIGPGRDFLAVHQFLPATLLTDALLTSGFALP